MPLRRGKRKVWSCNIVEYLIDALVVLLVVMSLAVMSLGTLKAAWAKAMQNGEVVRRKRPVMQTIFTVTPFRTLLTYHS